MSSFLLQMLAIVKALGALVPAPIEDRQHRPSQDDRFQHVRELMQHLADCDRLQALEHRVAALLQVSALVLAQAFDPHHHMVSLRHGGFCLRHARNWPRAYLDGDCCATHHFPGWGIEDLRVLFC